MIWIEYCVTWVARDNVSRIRWDFPLMKRTTTTMTMRTTTMRTTILHKRRAKEGNRRAEVRGDWIEMQRETGV